MSVVDCAIIGSGSIGTDLLLKIRRRSSVLRVHAMVGIEPASEGLSIARREGVAITARGLDGLLSMPVRLPLICATRRSCVRFRRRR